MSNFSRFEGPDFRPIKSKSPCIFDGPDTLACKSCEAEFNLDREDFERVCDLCCVAGCLNCMPRCSSCLEPICAAHMSTGPFGLICEECKQANRSVAA